MKDHLNAVVLSSDKGSLVDDISIEGIAFDLLALKDLRVDFHCLDHFLMTRTEPQYLQLSMKCPSSSPVTRISRPHMLPSGSFP